MKRRLKLELGNPKGHAMHEAMKAMIAVMLFARIFSPSPEAYGMQKQQKRPLIDPYRLPSKSA